MKVLELNAARVQKKRNEYVENVRAGRAKGNMRLTITFGEDLFNALLVRARNNDRSIAEEVRRIVINEVWKNE